MTTPDALRSTSNDELRRDSGDLFRERTISLSFLQVRRCDIRVLRKTKRSRPIHTTLRQAKIRRTRENGVHRIDARHAREHVDQVERQSSRRCDSGKESKDECDADQELGKRDELGDPRGIGYDKSYEGSRPTSRSWRLLCLIGTRARRRSQNP